MCPRQKTNVWFPRRQQKSESKPWKNGRAKSWRNKTLWLLTSTSGERGTELLWIFAQNHSWSHLFYGIWQPCRITNEQVWPWFLDLGCEKETRGSFRGSSLQVSTFSLKNGLVKPTAGWACLDAWKNLMVMFDRLGGIGFEDTQSLVENQLVPLRRVQWIIHSVGRWKSSLLILCLSE